MSQHRDVAQSGSVLAWGASGRWFESSHPDQENPTQKCWIFCLSEMETCSQIEAKTKKVILHQVGWIFLSEPTTFIKVKAKV